MSSTAISAQGSVLSIATGTGSAKTISAIALGNPTILTATAHGFNDGDVITLAALTGADMATLNGQTISVRNKTANTFAVYIDTTGKTITVGSGTATTSTFTAVASGQTDLRDLADRGVRLLGGAGHDLHTHAATKRVAR